MIATAEQIEIVIGDQILFDRPGSLFVGNVVEIREKAVKVDYALEPVAVGFASSPVVVFTRTCWMPKSVIVDLGNNNLSVKKWFSNKFDGGPRIKRYYVEGERKVFV